VVHLLIALLRALPSPALWALVAIAVLGTMAASSYLAAFVPVTVVVDGQRHDMRTHRETVGELLQDLQVEVERWDHVEPPLDTPIADDLRVQVWHARPVTLVADGQTRTLYTHQYALDEVLDQAGLQVKPGDELWVDGQRVVTTPLLAGAEPAQSGTVRASVSARAGPRQNARLPIARVEIRRAKVIYLDDDGVGQRVRTTASTLGQALMEAKVVVYLGDRIAPDLNAPVQTGMRVHIERAVPVSVRVDGRTLHTRTQQDTIANTLAELGIQLVGQDFCSPGLEQRVSSGLQIVVTRVFEELAVEQTEIPFETEWFADATLPIDHRRVEASGANGIRRRRYRVTYHDGIEVDRYLEDDWIAREPQLRKIAYGTEITVRTLDTPEGQIEYWRRIPVFLTSYTEATCGKTPDHPWYGLTRLGWKMRHGIIAVDPTVIRLLSKLYVPGYGMGVAADTGSLIKGRHIDLGHDVDNFTMYFEWGYVYVLTPVPPANQIRWILPDFPRGRYP
jgi:uncharacterized protein YabE (DUF348 family)/3D (Asp-Asp-Asp) domain-containing protein